MTERYRFAAAIVQLAPAWLQRGVGGRVLGAFGAAIDDLAQRTADGVRQRFPGFMGEESLGLLGRERRIRRGPSEPASTYVPRLRRWLVDHRVRGGPYALLRQYHAFLRDFAPGRIDLLAQSGLRHSCAEITGEITRDQITWEGDGHAASAPLLLAGNALPGDLELRPVSIVGFPIEGRYRIRLTNGVATEEVYALGTSTSPYGRIVLEAPGVVGTYLAGPASVRQAFAYWARIWIVVRLSGLVATDLLTEDGDGIETEDGDDLGGDVPPWLGAFDDVDADLWTAVPREWTAAHIQRTTIVLLFGAGELWDYPGESDGDGWTWDEWADPTKTVDDDAPVITSFEGD